MTDKYILIRQAALRSLSDQTCLMKFAKTLPAAELRVIAIKKITDETFLLARSREDSSMSVRAAAVNAMKSSDALIAVATDSYYANLRELAAGYPSLESTAKAKIATANNLRDQQLTNIGAETNQQILADTALNGKFDIVCLAAEKHISDQSLLAKVAMKTTDREIAKAALARLTNTSELTLNCL
jgi:hypothetical protein